MARTVISLEALMGNRTGHQLGSLADIWHWWVAQIRELWTNVASPAAEAPPLGVRIEVSRTGCRLPNGKECPLEQLGEVLNAFTPHGAVTGFMIVLAPDRFIRRPLASQLLPKSRLRAIAELDVVASTPFSSNAIAVLFPADVRSRGGKHCFLVKTDILQGIAAELSRAGVTGKTLAIVDGSDTVTLEYWHNVRTKTVRKRLANGAVLLAMSASIYAPFAIWSSASEANADLVDQVQILQERIKQIKPAFEKQKADETTLVEFASLQTTLPSATIVINELTRRLPDGSFVESISMDGRTLATVGHSSAAPDLISLLEASAVFSQVAFVGPTTRSPGQTGVRFEIKMDIAK